MREDVTIPRTEVRDEVAIPGIEARDEVSILRIEMRENVTRYLGWKRGTKWQIAGIEMRENVTIGTVPGIEWGTKWQCLGQKWGKMGLYRTWDRSEERSDNTWDRSEERGVPYTAWAPSHLLAGSRRFAQGPEYLSRDPALPPQLHRYHTHYNWGFPSHAFFPRIDADSSTVSFPWFDIDNRHIS